MLLKYFYDDKLAHASYLVGCQACNVALVVDPSRDVEKYISVAKAEGLRIVGVTETHIHADFLSGSRELASRTGATLYLSAEGGSEWSYPYAASYAHQPLHDGDTFSIGNIHFQVLHTPGHTPESISFLVTDGGAKAPKPMGIFSGDFVFVGDIGRPDLLEKAAGQKGTSDELARKMYHSLKRFRELPDFLQVWPAHGAGSACGKALGAIPSSTVGYEKMVNWALNEPDEDAFVAALLAGQPEPPRYFAMMKKLNNEGPTLLDEVAASKHVSASSETLAAWLKEGQVVDVRSAHQFAEKHAVGTLNITLNKSFVNWAGWLLDYDRPIYVLCDAQQAGAVRKDLQSIGLDGLVETMDVSVLNHPDVSVESYGEVRAEDIAGPIERGEVFLLDVRNHSEWEEGHIPQATHVMLGQLPDRVGEIPTDKPIVVQCRTGGRSAIAASVLQAHGVSNVQNLLGGYEEWLKLGHATTV
ncbi:MAG: MBL fold metallo-hydrolase [Alicyclobacillaceae bacterium]|nr:MBL fold metallo-hydrolase [Alicyclobacillaceae bacterium]